VVISEVLWALKRAVFLMQDVSVLDEVCLIDVG
jgi:hypothetical protein